MIFNVVALIIGVLLLGAGIYYLVQEKSDGESKKIYGITAAVGAVIVIIILARLLL